ncbi:MAG TPA: TIM barrel protein [Clostridiales bacterium]|nr:TIM barrel protein [Clostridiales bacterium]
MGIKRGVSFYSYQQAQFFGEMDYHDMCRELRETLGCDGVEIINETTVPKYPFPTREFLADWHNTMARYDLTPVALDGFLDTLRFRDHVMTRKEAGELLKLDLQLAADMGFKHVRTMTGLPSEVIEWALDTAVKLDVKIAWEIHTPIPIKPDPTIQGLYCESPGTAVYDTVEFIKKTGTKHVGFVPDMGIFTKAPYLDVVEAAVRHMKDRKFAANVEAMMKEVPLAELGEAIEKKYPGRLSPQEKRSFAWKTVAQPEDIELILPYICSIHGKVHDMIEVAPGVYDDPSTMNAEVIEVLKKNNWNGYICTEFEGQRSRQDQGREHLADEVDQVRRHHQMLKRLIGE